LLFQAIAKKKQLAEFTLDILSMVIKYYFYILECSNGKRYYGHTNDLIKRFIRHSRGQVKSTKNIRPVKLVYYEEFDTKPQAYKREIQFKNGKTRKETIEKLIKVFPVTKCQGFNSHL